LLHTIVIITATIIIDLLIPSGNSIHAASHIRSWSAEAALGQRWQTVRQSRWVQAIASADRWLKKMMTHSKGVAYRRWWKKTLGPNEHKI